MSDTYSKASFNAEAYAAEFAATLKDAPTRKLQDALAAFEAIKPSTFTPYTEEMLSVSRRVLRDELAARGGREVLDELIDRLATLRPSKHDSAQHWHTWSGAVRDLVTELSGRPGFDAADFVKRVGHSA